MTLKKNISLLGVFSIATGAMISSGIFILPGLAYSLAGPAVSISYLLAGLLGFIGILSVIELSTAMPKAGGDYFFINKALGPMIGTVSGLLGWIALSLKSAFAIFGISELVLVLFGFNLHISGLILVLLFVTLNIMGTKEAALFQICMVIGLLGLLAVYLVIGAKAVEPERFIPFIRTDYNQILITSGFVFVSFGGLLKVANISEEVKNPKRNIPLGILTSVIVVTLFYTAITVVLTGTMDPEAFAGSLTPVADSASSVMGPVGYILILIASFLAFFTTANAGIMAASRYPMALSHDSLLPSRFGFVNRRFNTPVEAIILTGILIFLSLLLPLETLVKSASTVILTSYVLTNISVIVLRESRLTNYKPSFRAPFYPYLQIFCILIFSFFIIDLGMDAVEISLSLIFIAFIIYFFYGKKLERRESAFIHMMKRIVDDRIVDSAFEDELREILIDRDNIEQDRFDTLIRQASIIDIEKHTDYTNLVSRISKDVSNKVGLDEKYISDLFLARQNDSNTAISDFLAVPHIILDGSGKEFLLIVRSREGISFTASEDSVKAVFFMGGTNDKKVFHLKTIAALATLVSDEGFEKKWIESESGIELKNLMLLSKRKRFF